jgi:hypothetical protein
MKARIFTFICIFLFTEIYSQHYGVYFLKLVFHQAQIESCEKLQPGLYFAFMDEANYSGGVYLHRIETAKDEPTDRLFNNKIFIN